MPLADHSGGVAFLPEELRQRHLFVAEAEFVPRLQSPGDADAIRIAAGHQSGARGGADALGDMKIGEADSLAGETVEIGRRKSFRAINAEVGVSLIVGKYQYDIRQRLILRSD